MNSLLSVNNLFTHAFMILIWRLVLRTKIERQRYIERFDHYNHRQEEYKRKLHSQKLFNFKVNHTIMFRFIIAIFVIQLAISQGFKIQPRVINGVRSNVTDFPFFVNIMHRAESGMSVCGASLISDRYVKKKLTVEFTQLTDYLLNFLLYYLLDTLCT